jgi:hypothetical protein
VRFQTKGIGYVISAAPLKELARGQLGLRGAEEGI